VTAVTSEERGTSANHPAPDYDDRARERWVAEPPKRASRTPFERDRARVLHSSALRRLAAKTQVVVPWESDFPRTRLTHSLECAQVGRELGQALGCDPDVVETACLAHDLGHPPFGHNGEMALNEVAQPCGGFEGNAQSLRILTRLEAKTFSTGEPGSVRSVGLNLTRASLDGATKYPWGADVDPRKYGVYTDDLDVFQWLRCGAPERRRCIEAQVMDWADDVAYSVHDLEDGVHAGLVTPKRMSDPGERRALLEVAARHYADASIDELSAALDRLEALPYWPTAYDGSQRSLARLKDTTSQLIGRFCQSVEDATRVRYGTSALRRYDADLVVPREIRLECDVLKAMTAHFVMAREGAATLQAAQRELVTELVMLVLDGAPETLDVALRPAFIHAADDASRLRVVVDQVASLTDPAALSLHARLSA
jgi:dGTPase